MKEETERGARHDHWENARSVSELDMEKGIGRETAD